MLLKAELLIDGDPVDITGYSVRTPTNGMGRSISVALSEPNPDLIGEDTVIQFKLYSGIETAPGVISWSSKTYLDSGKMDGRRFSVRWVADEAGGFPGDVVEFDSLSPLADKLGLAPLKPLIMYDPDKIEGDTLIPDDLSLTQYYENGYNSAPTLLAPILEPIQGMRLYDVLNRVYAGISPSLHLKTLKRIKARYSRDFAAESKTLSGLGFNSVICNLPNSSVERFDANITSGFHRPAVSLLGLFEPLPFEDDNNNFYLLDPDYAIPPGMPLKTLSLDCHIEDITESIAPAPLINAVLLTYNQTGLGETLSGGEIPDIKFIYEPPFEQGAGKNYIRREVFRKVTEFKDINTGAIRRRQENETVTTTYGYRDDIQVNVDGTRERVTGSVKILSVEVMQNRYSGRTKSGHTKTVEAIFTNPETGADDFDTVFTEEQALQWEADLANPGASIQKKSITTTSGLVLQETKEDGLTIFTPILRATNSGLVENGEQTLLAGDIQTVVEELRYTAPGQSNVDVTIIDHLSGGLEPIPTQARPGSVSNHIPNLTLRRLSGSRPGTITELITDEESIAAVGLRQAVTLDVKNLDPEEGRELARRKIAKSKRPPKTYAISLPGIDFAIRRGTLLAPILETSTRNLIVTGDTITGRGIGTEQETHKQTLEAREVLNGLY